MSKIGTTSGRLVDLVNPDLTGIRLEEISGPLGRIQRFGSQPLAAYSVLTHSLFVFRIVKGWDASPAAQLHAALHDSQEFVLGDIPTPLKEMLPDYAPIEARMQRAIYRAFGVEHILDDEDALSTVKRADRLALVTEAFRLGLVVGYAEEAWMEMYEQFGYDDKFYLREGIGWPSHAAFQTAVERLLPLVQR